MATSTLSPITTRMSSPILSPMIFGLQARSDACLRMHLAYLVALILIHIYSAYLSCWFLFLVISIIGMTDDSHALDDTIFKKKKSLTILKPCRMPSPDTSTLRSWCDGSLNAIVWQSPLQLLCKTLTCIVWMSDKGGRVDIEQSAKNRLLTKANNVYIQSQEHGWQSDKWIEALSLVWHSSVWKLLWWHQKSLEL